MRVDIYRRAEQAGIFSYLVVPEGKPIPDEATGIDWQQESRALELDETAAALPNYHIERPFEQIAAKGYAITGLKDMTAPH
ncbi:MAG TPA: hypothetical protein DCW29_25305 [Janthinobacterium sp.]|nr:hypothetical protein [Janthinobacterium sp.]